MPREIIGRGTWLDKVALKVVERERKLGRYGGVLRTESGLGASGIPHIGSVGDAIRAYGVKLALEDMGERAELIAFADDMDGLRKVPVGLPNWLGEYLGFPVTSIPDPFKCHESYGAHMASLLLDALDRCGVEYRFISATEAHRRGMLAEQIHKILINARKVGMIIKEEVGQDTYMHVLPYFPICQKCGRIYTAKAYGYLPDERKVLFKCEGETVIKGHRLEGCGYSGEVAIREGEGKLVWKGEFAARWDALKINYEAYGKDIMDSVRINDRISQEILGYPPPYHVRYELFVDKSGKKIAKSVGNALTPQVWLRYGSPQTLLLLMFKRIIGTRTISVDDIPNYMREFDGLEDIYFDKKPVEDERERAKLKGLYEYVWLLKPPEEPSIHVPYDLLVYLARVAPQGKELEYIAAKLKGYGYVKGELPESVHERISYALNWAADFPEEKIFIPALAVAEREAIKELVGVIRSEPEAEALQSAIFEVGRKHGVEPGEFFKLLYMILLGSPKGPRLSPYIQAMGYQKASQILEEAIKLN